ncbi:MAG: hypothetical protein IBX70_13555 [Clostridia bacterium]|nr:hypothetical protein [Clostridia bacterium]
MDNELLKKYIKYASSSEAFAVLFVKKYLGASEGHWVDILDYDDHRYYYQENLEFKRVECAIFERKIKPVYPPKSGFKSTNDYEMACRAITWETANKDILYQRNKKIKPQVYQIEGVKYNATRGTTYFIDNAPAEIKDLERNLFDRTNPLWDEALQYVRKPNYVFKIRQIKLLS